MNTARFRAAGAAGAVGAALVLVAAFVASPLAAQGAGSGATTILRVAPGPVPLSLGNAYSAVRGPLALEYNPAGLSGPHGFAASYQTLPADVSAGSAQLTRPYGRIDVGASLRFLDYGDIDVVERSGSTPVGQPTGETASGGEVSALVGASVAFGPLRLGGAGRWLRMEVAGLSDQAAALDLGALLAITSGLDVGVSIQHLGADVEVGRAAPLPRTVRVGAALRGAVAGVDLLLTAEAREREDRRGAGVGLEVARSWGDAEAALRLGYETRPDSGDVFSPLVIGGGVRLGPLGVQLAWRSIGPLGATRQVGLTYRF
jgi:hypothetical protein